MPREQLTTGQGALETSQSAAQIAGPALAGWLVQVLSAPIAILADALSFVVSAGALAGVRVREERVRTARRPGTLRQMIGGGKAVFHPRLLRYLTLCTTNHIFCYNAFLQVPVRYLLTRM